MEEKYIKIIEGAIRLFNKYGIRSVSMDDLSRELGMSKKTVYQFVNNKSDLVEKMLEYDVEYVLLDERSTDHMQLKHPSYLYSRNVLYN